MGNRVAPPIPAKADERIADASAKNATELALDDLYDLHAIPPKVAQLLQLQKLSIARCRLNSVQNLTPLLSLRDLTLSFNLLGDRCDWTQIAALRNLRLLDFSHNAGITTIPSQLFVGLSQLEHINLSYTHLSAIPESITCLASLTNLDVSCCKLTSVPASIYALSALQELNLYYNGLTTFPSRPPTQPLGLRQLRRLSISQNRLTSLPDDLFEGMTRLAELDFWENSLSAIPPSISHCVMLRVMLASANALASYPLGFTCLTTLAIVNLYSNKLTALPPLATLTNLTKLVLRGNLIATLPSYIPRLPLLKEADLRDNPFVTIADSASSQLNGLLTSLPNEVHPHLFIGGQAGVENFDWLKSQHIALIINMAAEIVPKYPTKFNYFCVPCMDSEKYDIVANLGITFALIDSYISKGKNVLVHCAQGRSRSGAIVVAFVMRKLRLPYEQALETVQQRRSLVHPNFGFARQLRKWGDEQGLPSPTPAPQTNAPPKQVAE